jgi:predicted GNAT family acetyltransferase
MTAFQDHVAARRYHQDFPDAEGEDRRVWAEYVARGKTRVILHVEAAPALRGTGAASTFMQSLAEHARAEGLKLEPICSYAMLWLKRHPEYADVLGS